MLNGGPEGIKAFKRWAIRQPLRWGIGLPTKEAAEKELAKMSRAWDRSNVCRDQVLYILPGQNGGWDIWGARLYRKPPELTE